MGTTQYYTVRTAMSSSFYFEVKLEFNPDDVGGEATSLEVVNAIKAYLSTKTSDTVYASRTYVDSESV